MVILIIFYILTICIFICTFSTYVYCTIYYLQFYTCIKYECSYNCMLVKSEHTHMLTHLTRYKSEG